MPVLAWLAKLAGTEAMAGLIKLIPPVAKALQEFFESHANRSEQKAAVIQAKAAGKIADNAERAEALRAASKRLTDQTGSR